MVNAADPRRSPGLLGTLALRGLLARREGFPARLVRARRDDAPLQQRITMRLTDRDAASSWDWVAGMLAAPIEQLYARTRNWTEFVELPVPGDSWCCERVTNASLGVSLLCAAYRVLDGAYTEVAFTLGGYPDVTVSRAETIVRTEIMGAMDAARRTPYPIDGVGSTVRIRKPGRYASEDGAVREDIVEPVDLAPFRRPSRVINLEDE